MWLVPVRRVETGLFRHLVTRAVPPSSLAHRRLPLDPLGSGEASVCFLTVCRGGRYRLMIVRNVRSEISQIVYRDWIVSGSLGVDVLTCVSVHIHHRDLSVRVEAPVRRNTMFIISIMQEVGQKRSVTVVTEAACRATDRSYIDWLNM